jgi:hypothetical protein
VTLLDGLAHAQPPVTASREKRKLHANWPIAPQIQAPCGAARARVAKFVIDISNHVPRALQSHGYEQAYDLSAAFRSDVRGSDSPLAVHELQIGGTPAEKPSRGALAGSLASLPQTRSSTWNLLGCHGIFERKTEATPVRLFIAQ